MIHDQSMFMVHVSDRQAREKKTGNFRFLQMQCRSGGIIRYASDQLRVKTNVKIIPEATGKKGKRGGLKIFYGGKIFK
jgi:hypothetical protein